MSFNGVHLECPSLMWTSWFRGNVFILNGSAIVRDETADLHVKYSRILGEIVVLPSG
jgi:hypothetical protein